MLPTTYTGKEKMRDENMLCGVNKNCAREKLKLILKLDFKEKKWERREERRPPRSTGF